MRCQKSSNMGLGRLCMLVDATEVKQKPSVNKSIKLHMPSQRQLAGQQDKQLQPGEGVGWQRGGLGTRLGGGGGGGGVMHTCS